MKKNIIVGFTAMVVGRPDANGNIYTREALEGALAGIKGKGIGYEFNPNIPHFGKVTDARIVDDKLIIDGEIETTFFNERLAIVPSFLVKRMHKEGETKVIDEAEIIEMSLTSQPADKEATMKRL